ncbi:hypothetical protein SLE2022_319700 [Rubroshorea leprosula]
MEFSGSNILNLLELVNFQDDMSMSIFGTVVIRSLRGSESLSLQSSVSSSQCASVEDASTSGTVVVRGQNDGSDSPRTPKSRLGNLERNSSASLEDSATNLAEVVDMYFTYYFLGVLS